MDDDAFEERDPWTADDRTKAGRCARIALVLVVILIPGVFPGSFIGGVLAVKTVGELLGLRLGEGLAGRMIVLAGMAAGLLIASGCLLFLAMAIARITRGLARWSSFVTHRHSV